MLLSCDTSVWLVVMFSLCSCFIMYVCIFSQHYRIHMTIGNSKNYLGIMGVWVYPFHMLCGLAVQHSTTDQANQTIAQIKQNGLTPSEKGELINEVKLLKRLGWVETTTNQRCNSVLFIPKPGQKLKFCVSICSQNMTKDPPCSR